MNLLCFLISLCACTSSVIALAARQGDGLDLIFDSKTRQRAARYYNSPTLVADLASKVSPQEGLRASDKISKLPGQPAQGVGFNQYAGYVSVDKHAGRALFYYFVEAAQPEKKPLLLWLNGGPGCSSFGVGAMEELGPFRVMSDGKTLYLNPYSWNKAANVLFLESPAGVGFSYSNTTSDYRKSGDQRTSDDAYIFLVNWLERFPEYKGSDFYIAGESYAGHYVPQLAQAILQHNIAAAATTTDIHLKGIMIGNAVINDETDTKGMYDFFWTHALISDETIGVIHKDCDFSPNATQNGDRCQRAIDVADQAVFGGDLDVYNIYAPLCTTDGVTAKPKTPSIKNFDPCSSNYVTSYLNDVEVQRALHANVTNLNYTWSVCSRVIPKWNDSPSTVLPLLKEFLANGIRVLVYSGDMDARVPVTSSRYSVNELKLAVKSPWNSWKVNGEVGGYNVIYDGNLTFATVRGAGHEVPSYQGLRGLVLVKSFLASKPLPT